jgi:putative DNA primase/helicase
MSTTKQLATHDLPTANDYDKVELICAGRNPAQPLQWLWPERIPLGKVTLLVGDPGCGKSLVALDIAARTTRALPWPDEERQPDKVRGRQGDSTSEPPISLSPCLPLSPSSVLPLSPSSVLLLSAEDDLADTIRPRLDAAGADPNRVFILPAVADLRHDFAQLEAAVNRTPDCRLIIVDPINAYVGPNDSHFQTVVRKVLAPLAHLAAEHGIAVLALAHFRKSHGAAIYRAAGSMGFVSAARSVWTVCRDHSEPGNHFFLPLKTNLSAPASGLAYKIDAHESGYAMIRWDPTPATISAQAALAPPPKPPREPSGDRAAARQWLCEILADGPRPASEIFENGKLRGLLSRTLQRAFHELDGHTAKMGLHHGWWWSLSDQPTDEDPDDTQKTADAFEGVTYEQDIADQIEYDKFWANFSTPRWSPPPGFTAFHANRPTLAQSTAALDRIRRQREEFARADTFDPDAAIDRQTFDKALKTLRKEVKHSSKISANPKPPDTS